VGGAAVRLRSYALTYTDASPAPYRKAGNPAEGETLVELRPSEMEALREYIRIAALLRAPPAERLAERARTAYFDGPTTAGRCA
jgi:hypothetical protein